MNFFLQFLLPLFRDLNRRKQASARNKKKELSFICCEQEKTQRPEMMQFASIFSSFILAFFFWVTLSFFFPPDTDKQHAVNCLDWCSVLSLQSVVEQLSHLPNLSLRPIFILLLLHSRKLDSFFVVRFPLFFVRHLRGILLMNNLMFYRLSWNMFTKVFALNTFMLSFGGFTTTETSVTN